MRNFFSRLAEVFQGKPRKGASPPSRTSTEYGFLVFQHTGEVIRAERILREAGFAVEVKGPPPELRTGCDMIIVFDLMQEPLIRNALGAARLERYTDVSLDTREGLAWADAAEAIIFNGLAKAQEQFNGR